VTRFARAGLAIAIPGALLLGCSGAADRTEPASVESGAAPARLLALGDSYTIGQGVLGRERWPEQLAARLREQGIIVAAPQIIAATGWTTADLLAAMDRTPPRGPFALVTVLIGVNNQYQGRDLDEYRSELHTVLQRATALAGNAKDRVVVLSIPDWSVTPFASGRDRERVSGEIERFNRACREEVERAGVGFVDVTPVSRQAARESDLLAGDGLHPSGKMYAAWVDLAMPSAVAALTGAAPP
jgi:lysophospholipase L1-like esterase